MLTCGSRGDPWSPGHLLIPYNYCMSWHLVDFFALCIDTTPVDRPPPNKILDPLLMLVNINTTQACYNINSHVIVSKERTL